MHCKQQRSWRRASCERSSGLEHANRDSRTRSLDAGQQQWRAHKQARIGRTDSKRVDKHICQRRNYFCQRHRAPLVAASCRRRTAVADSKIVAYQPCDPHVLPGLEWRGILPPDYCLAVAGGLSARFPGSLINKPRRRAGHLCACPLAKIHDPQAGVTVLLGVLFGPQEPQKFRGGVG